MKKIFYLFLAVFAFISSIAQTTQSFNTAVKFNVVAPSAAGTSKALFLQNNGLLSYYTLAEVAELTQTKLISITGMEMITGGVYYDEVVWKIYGTQYVKSAATVNIPLATAGFYRTDIIVGNTSGQLVRIAGTESEEITDAPLTPDNTVLVSTVNIFGPTIYPALPNFDDYIKKSHESQQNINNVGDSDIFSWNNQTTYRHTSSGNTTIGSMALNCASCRYDGQLLTWINDPVASGNTVTIKHMLPTGIVKFYIPDATDIILQDGEMATFKYSLLRNRLELYSRNFSSLTLQKVLESGSTGIVDKNISVVSADFDNNEVLGIEHIYSEALNIYKQTESGSAGFELDFSVPGITVIDNESQIGLQGAEYFGDNATDNTYVQKKYVDAEIADVVAGLEFIEINEQFNYSGSQIFTLSENTTNLTVYLNGQYLENTQYTLLGTTLTILPTLTTGDRIQVEARLNASELTTNRFAYLEQQGLLQPLNFNQSPYYDKLSGFADKYNNRTSDVTLVQIGDSWSTNLNYTTTATDANQRPPFITEKNINYFLEEKLRWREQSYRRFDYGGIFTETLGGGTASNLLEDSTAWGFTTPGLNFQFPLTRCIDSGTNAGVSYTFPAGMRRCNFILHTDLKWATSTSITISTGNGKVEVYDEGTETWVEANGYVFSAKEPATVFTGSGGNYHRDTYQKRINMRSLTDLTAKTVTIQNSGAGRFGYWGIEYSPNQYMFTYICAAKGGHNIERIRQFEEWTVDIFNPDLILQQACIINQQATVNPPTKTPETFVSEFEDYYDNLVTVKGYLVMPYIAFIGQQAGIVDESTGAWRSGTISGKSVTIPDYIQPLATMYRSKNAPFVNLFNTFLNIGFTKASLDGSDNLWTSFMQGSGKTGNTFSIDGIHPNDYGTQIILRGLSYYLNF